MGTGKPVVILATALLLQLGCASTSEPIANKATAVESGGTLYRYAPLNASASRAKTAEYRKSMQSLNAAIKKDRADVNSLKRRGALLAEAGQFEKAEKDYEAAFDYLSLQKPSPTKNMLLSDLHMQRALLKRERGDQPGALADLTTSVEMAPQSWQPRFHRWQLCREMGMTAEATAEREAGMKLMPKVFSQTYDSKQGII